MSDPIKDSEHFQTSAEKAIKDSQALMLPATDDILAMADWPKRNPLFKRIRVRKRLYVFIFILLSLILSIGSFRLFHEDESPVQLFERLYMPSVFNAFPEPLPTNKDQLAEEFGMGVGEIASAEEVMQKIYDRNTRAFLGPLDWGLNIKFSSYRLVISYRIILNMAIALIVSLSLYLLARSSQASEIIEAQNQDLRKLTDTLKVKVSEAERYLNELTKTQYSLLQAQKLASIGRLSATLAHEIRNPMSIIKSAAMMARDDVPKDSPALDSLYLIQQETIRLDGIITDLLHFAKPKKPTIVDVSLVESVKSWVQGIQEELNRSNINIKIEYQENLPKVLIDPDQLYQIFLNIIWNARDAMRAQSGDNKNPSIKVSIDTAGPTTVTLIIEDNGPGMSDETLKQIYEPFYTTKTHGTGLGLPMVQQLMEGMKGSVIIDSTEGKGTIVTLVINSEKNKKNRYYSKSNTPSIEYEPNLELEESTKH